jgi:hypothetical protein
MNSRFLPQPIGRNIDGGKAEGTRLVAGHIDESRRTDRSLPPDPHERNLVLDARQSCANRS